VKFMAKPTDSTRGRPKGSKGKRSPKRRYHNAAKLRHAAEVLLAQHESNRPINITWIANEVRKRLQKQFGDECFARGSSAAQRTATIRRLLTRLRVRETPADVLQQRTVAVLRDLEAQRRIEFTQKVERKNSFS
jgi:hypothetical protein